MSETHPDPIEGDIRVPWEWLGQVTPGALLVADPERYPPPWNTHGRGNGHVDVYDGRGRYFAHVYCYDTKDARTLERAVEVTEIAAAKSEAEGLDRAEFHRAGSKSDDYVAAITAWSKATVKLDRLEARATLRLMLDTEPPFVERKALVLAIMALSGQ